MQQILQDLKNGEVHLVDLPVPNCGANQILIRTHRTLVSLGTEKMLLQFGRSGWIGKAKSQPEKVKQVLQKIKTDGLKPTIDAVLNKLDQPMPLGYCNVGTVQEVGSQVRAFKVGDRVVSNGSHAEFVCVPENLCAKVPDEVSDETAAFTVISAIGLQGIRLAAPTLGETFVVMGLGLIGLLTVQILRAQGCEVIGFDFDEAKLRQAKAYGAKVFGLDNDSDPVAQVLSIVPQGADGILITAATDSNQPIESAAKMARQKGRIVLVGVSGLKLSRDEFFKKEISFQVSCSYGPGRYDFNYEQRALDYPIGYVRWTEQRNFSAVLGLMSRNLIQVDSLISERVDLKNAPTLYASLTERKDILGVLLQYSPEMPAKNLIQVNLRQVPTQSSNRATLGLIGAGSFAQSTLLPVFKNTQAEMHTVVGRQGLSPQHLAKKFGFHLASTQTSAVIGNKEINTVVISTPHNSHASLVCQALKAGQNVFVEKPLAITHEELDMVEETVRSLKNPPLLMVGFNRRFSPLTQRLKKALTKNPGPISMIMTVNAGFVPRDHWTQDPARGGGRFIGEGCHFVDLLRHLAGSPIVDGDTQFAESECSDTFTSTLRFANGSIGTIHYFANGNKSFPKETLQVFGASNIYVIDNFRKLIGYGRGAKSASKSLWSQDKGHQNQVKEFVNSVCISSHSPISLEEIFEVSRWTLKLAVGDPTSVQTTKVLIGGA